MSKDFALKRVTAPDIRNRKGGAPIVALTAYHAHTARIIDPHVDMLLVGDSLGMVMHGYETTVPVPLELMIMHAQAVVRGSTRALVVVDMPFGSYEESPAVAFRNAARVHEGNRLRRHQARGRRAYGRDHSLSLERGIPVMSHIGMTPQAINTIGSFKPRGRLRSEWAAFEADAKAVADAGAFAVVLEALAELLAARITKQIAIPTIGIGASAECDGQILVLEDMLGLSARACRNSSRNMRRSARASRPRSRPSPMRCGAATFPSSDYTYPMFEDDPEVTKKTKMTGS